MKTKRIISLLASLAMMVTAVTGTMSVSAISADDGEFDLNTYYTFGRCGDKATWLINSDGVLVVSGTGVMSPSYTNPSNSSKCWGWDKLGKDVNKIVIEDGITGCNTNISCLPFSVTSFSTVSNIILPASLTKLEYILNYPPIMSSYLNNIYIYSKDISDSDFSLFEYNDIDTNLWSQREVIWHVYKDSATEVSLRENLSLKDNQIEYIPDGEQMPVIDNKTPAELGQVTDTSGPAGLTTKYEWNETSKTLTFSGKGVISIADYYKQYAEETEHIVIKSGITNLDADTGIVTVGGSGASDYYSSSFTGFTALKDVKLPDTLTIISDSSFRGDANLEEINFPKALNKIGEGAFAYCSKLKSIKLHEGMTIGGGAFTCCESLKEVTIPKNVTFEPVTFGGAGLVRAHSTFSYCTGIEKVVIEDGSVLKDTWEKAYTQDGIPTNFCTGCSSLKTVIIKGDVDYIAEAFRLCTSLTDIYLYNLNLKTITHAKGSPNGAFATNNPTDPNNWLDSFWTGNNPTFHVIKGSQTEQTLKEAGYLTKENTVYIADTTALETAISEAEAIETDKYTDESVSAFTKAIESAKAVLENLNATQDEVDNAVKAIEDAKNALTDKSGEPSTDNSSNSSDNNNQSQSPNTPATPSTSAPTTATPKQPTTPPTVTTTVAKPAKVKAVKVKAKKKKLNVSWKKVSGATGYEVKYAKNNKFTKGKKTVTVKQNKVTLKKLKPKKKYFVKVRAYKLANGRKYFGKWSKVVKKKTK